MAKEHVYVANIASDMINQRLDLCCIVFTVHPLTMLPFIFQQFHGMFQGVSGVGKGIVVTHGIDVILRFFFADECPRRGICRYGVAERSDREFVDWEHLDQVFCKVLHFTVRVYECMQKFERSKYEYFPPDN